MQSRVPDVVPGGQAIAAFMCCKLLHGQCDASFALIAIPNELIVMMLQVCVKLEVRHALADMKHDWPG